MTHHRKHRAALLAAAITCVLLFVSTAPAEDSATTPEDVALYYRARAALFQGHYADAAKHLEAIVHVMPWLPANWHDLAWARAGLGDTTAAVTALAHAHATGMRDTSSMLDTEPLRGLRGNARFDSLLATVAGQMAGGPTLAFLQRPVVAEYLTDLPEGEPPRAGWPVVIVLHGGARSMRHAESLTRELDWPEAAYVYVNGAYSFERTAGQYAFYRHDVPDSIRLQIQVTDARWIAGALLDDALARYPLDPERVAVMGFSQGARMAQYAGTVAPERFAAVVSLCGFMPDATASEENLASWRELGLRVFLAWGAQEMEAWREGNERARDRLLDAGVNVRAQAYPGGHETHPKMMADLNTWLRDALGE